MTPLGLADLRSVWVDPESRRSCRANYRTDRLRSYDLDRTIAIDQKQVVEELLLGPRGSAEDLRRRSPEADLAKTARLLLILGGSRDEKIGGGPTSNTTPWAFTSSART